MKTLHHSLRALLLAWVVPFFAAAYAGAAPPVNFIQILTDDQGWGDLGSFGHPLLKTPNIDRLAQEGIKFTRCYSADSVCSPSRAAILTGRTPYRNGVYRWIPSDHFCHLPAAEITLPQLLQKKGYQTAHFGKWHLSHFSEKRNTEAGRGQYKDFVFGGHPQQPSMKDYGYDYWFAAGNVARPSHKNPQNFFLNGKAMGQMEGFAAQLVAGQFKQWIQAQRDADKPFFATIWFCEPHGPVDSDPLWMERYGELNDASLRQYLANVTQIDEAVGSILQDLQAVGAAEDTLIWYTSDNGPEGPHEFGTFNQSDSAFDNSRYRGSTGGLRGRKRHTHEGGIRVPGIIWWPQGLQKFNVPPGSVSAEPVTGCDIFPTLLELAGAALPQDRVLDGVSIVPLLKGETLKRPRPLYWRNNYNRFQLALLDGDWKLVGNAKRTEFELYNLRADPRETSNAALLQPERFERMKAELIKYDLEVLSEGPDWWNKKADRRSAIPVE